MKIGHEKPFKYVNQIAIRNQDKDNQGPQVSMTSFERYIPLNVIYSEVLRQTENHNTLDRPNLMKTLANRRNHDKYCQFHNDFGHKNDDRFDLEEKIERLT